MHDDHYHGGNPEPPMGAGTRALFWALLTFSVVTGAWTAGTLIYWLFTFIGAHTHG